jgi:hypothetical protein
MTGTQVFEAPSAELLYKWIFNWSETAVSTDIQPVLDENDLRALVLGRVPDYKVDYSNLSAPLDEGYTHFKMSYKIHEASKVQAYDLLANMSEGEYKIASGEVKNLGTFHYASVGTGFAICSAKSASDLMAWAMKWAPMSDHKIEPVLDDVTVQKVYKAKPGYDKKLEALVASM